MESVLQSTISALGYSENGVYYPEPDCYESIRDLIRFLRNDSETLLVRRVCGERNIVQNDLIPIMKASDTPQNLFDIALRLAINLSQPAMVAFGGKRPEDKETWKAYWQVQNNLKRSKLAFADVDFLKVLQVKLTEFFNTEWSNRDEETKVMMERIVVLLRYVLSIGNSSDDKQRTAGDINSQDRLVLAIFESGLGDVIIKISASQERDFHLSMLEIIALIVKQHEAYSIVSAGRDRSKIEKEKDEQELKRSVAMETEKQLEARRKLSMRHSRFAGSYIVKGLKAINTENDMVVQKVLKNIGGIDHLDERKVKKRQPKNRRPFEGAECTHISALDVRIALKKFCTNVLQKCYNRIMRSCKDPAFGGRRTLGQRNSDIHYFLAMRFFMEFRRLSHFPVELVSSTMSKETFHHVQTQLDDYLESARIERKEGKLHGLRAQFAVGAYKELLSTLISIIEAGHDEEKADAEAICIHIMQMEEYRDLSSSTIRKFMPGALSKTFLRNLVLANHLYIRLLEKCAKSGRLSKVIKRQKARRKRMRKLKVDTEITEENDMEDLDEVWEEICEELSDILNGYGDPSDDVSPIDALIKADEDVLQEFAMLSVQRSLRERRVADGVGVYRAARSLWPFDGNFGTNEITAEEEFIELRAIFFADLSEVEKQYKESRKEAYGDSDDENDEQNLFDDEEGIGSARYSGSEEEGATRYVTKEIDFDFNEYVKKFARADVLRWYVFLLAEYKTNSSELNRALLKLLHRVAFDLGSASRLYQLSLFRIFQKVGDHFKILPRERIKKDPYFGIYEFGFHLLRKYFAAYKTLGWRLIPETLFWKGPKDCEEIDSGYTLTGITSKGKEPLWTEDLDNELRSLYEEYVNYDDKPEGIDIVEFLGTNLSCERTRRQIIREMKSLGLDTMGAKVNTCGARSWKSSTMFAPDILEYIHSLTEQFNSHPEDERPGDLVDFIRERLPEKHSRGRIIKQLNYEGIQYERKDKKKSRKPWDEELMTELRALNLQYEELEEKSSDDLADYAIRRLSVKKSRRDVISKLKEIGANMSFIRTPIRSEKSGKRDLERRNTFSKQDDKSDSERERGASSALSDLSLNLEHRTPSPALSMEFDMSDVEDRVDLLPICRLNLSQRSLSSTNFSFRDLQEGSIVNVDPSFTSVRANIIEEQDVVEYSGGRKSDDRYRKDDHIADEEIVMRRRKRSALSVSPVPEDEPDNYASVTPLRKKRVVISDEDD